MHSKDKATDKVWCVYMHTTPCGKHYIGITSHSDNPNKRWRGGNGYKDQKLFYRAIQKYGWDKIDHEILSTELSFEDACKKEKYYIDFYHTNVLKYKEKANGYNMTSGGDSLSDERMMEENVYSKIRKRIDCYSFEGVYLTTYDSISQAADSLQIQETSIRSVLHNKMNVAGINKLRFTFHDQPLTDINKKLFKRNIYMFDFNGKYITTFDSCTSASIYLTGQSGATSLIAKCAKGERGSYKGYLFSYSQNPQICNRTNGHNRSVDMFDIHGNYIQTFDSLSDARKYAAPQTKTITQIIRVCDGLRKTAYGYIWKYHNNDVFKAKGQQCA